jgi:hypothetical protein
MSDDAYLLVSLSWCEYQQSRSVCVLIEFVQLIIANYALPLNVVFKLLDSDFLILDDALYEVAD